MRIVPAVLLLALAACHWGVRPDTFRPANGPWGAAVAVRARGETVDRAGELLAADSSGVTISSLGVTRIAWSRVAAIDVDQLGSEYDVRFGEVPDAAKRARLASVSRFPQGLSADLLAKVLAALKQAGLEELK